MMTLPTRRSRRVELGPGLVGVALERLDLLAQLAGVRPRLVRHLLEVVGVVGARLLRLLEGAHRGADRLADGLLLGAQLLEVAEGRSTALVGGEDRVHDPRVLPTGLLRGADPVGFVAHELDVDHAGQPIGAPTRPTTEIPPVRTPRPLARLGADEGVCRHGVGREAADVDLDVSGRQPEVHGPLDGAVAREGAGVERLAVAPRAGCRVVDGIAGARRRVGGRGGTWAGGAALRPGSLGTLRIERPVPAWSRRPARPPPPLDVRRHRHHGTRAGSWA